MEIISSYIILESRLVGVVNWRYSTVQLGSRRKRGREGSKKEYNDCDKIFKRQKNYLQQFTQVKSPEKSTAWQKEKKEREGIVTSKNVNVEKL